MSLEALELSDSIMVVKLEFLLERAGLQVCTYLVGYLLARLKSEGFTLLDEGSSLVFKQFYPYISRAQFPVRVNLRIPNHVFRAAQCLGHRPWALGSCSSTRSLLGVLVSSEPFGISVLLYNVSSHTIQLSDMFYALNSFLYIRQP